MRSGNHDDNFHREIAEHSRSSNHFLGNHHLLSWSHRVEEGGRRGEGWYHCVEEEGRGVVPPCGGGGERDGTTVWRRRRRERERLFSICEITTCLIRASMG